MNIAIIDADIVGATKHRFPNLCCMKLSAYFKAQGHSVVLKTDYNDTDYYDKVFVSKVFTKTVIPCEPDDKSNKTESNIIEYYKDNEFLQKPNIEYGGTGFFYDKAPPLPYEIEHFMPDYHLYDDWVAEKIAHGVKRSEFTYYLDYSIGFLTRRCFRQCYYCVNRNYKKVEIASPLDEFMDESRPKLCFLDDNFFGNPDWKTIIQPVLKTGKRFQFKQGLDERLLTVDKIQALNEWKYDGDLIFAFDNICDKDRIVEKLDLIYSTIPDFKRRLKFYVFCGCDVENKYDRAFFEKDIHDLFERIKILSDFGAIPYIMRFEKVYDTEYAQFYTSVAAWCNQPSIFNSFTFDLFCKCKGMRGEGYSKYKRDIDRYLQDIGKKGTSWRALEKVQSEFPHIANEYFHFVGEAHKRK